MNVGLSSMKRTVYYNYIKCECKDKLKDDAKFDLFLTKEVGNHGNLFIIILLFSLEFIRYIH